MAALACTSCRQRVERFFLIRQLHISLIGIGLRRRIRLIHARFLKLVVEVDLFHLEGRRLLMLGEKCLHRLEFRPIKIEAEHRVKQERDKQTNEKPIALLGARPNRHFVELLAALDRFHRN